MVIGRHLEDELLVPVLPRADDRPLDEGPGYAEAPAGWGDGEGVDPGGAAGGGEHQAPADLEVGAAVDPEGGAPDAGDQVPEAAGREGDPGREGGALDLGERGKVGERGAPYHGRFSLAAVAVEAVRAPASRGAIWLGPIGGRPRISQAAQAEQEASQRKRRAAR